MTTIQTVVPALSKYAFFWRSGRCDIRKGENYTAAMSSISPAVQVAGNPMYAFYVRGDLDHYVEVPPHSKHYHLSDSDLEEALRASK